MLSQKERQRIYDVVKAANVTNIRNVVSAVCKFVDLEKYYGGKRDAYWILDRLKIHQPQLFRGKK